MQRFIVSMLAGLLLTMLLLPPGGRAEAQTPALPPSGLFISGAIPADGGFGLVVFAGGSYDQLVSASGCPVARVAFWVTAGGEFLVYVPGAAVAAPNAGFAAAFPNRMIPPFTGLIGRCTPVTASGVRGMVTLGPVCPVQSDLLPCPDRPYVATLLFLDLTGREAGRVTSGADGRYSIALAAGSYTLVPLSPGGAPLPRAAAQRVEVLAGRITDADVAYDSGIRSVQSAP